MSMPDKIYIDWPPNRSGFVIGCIAPFNAVEHEYISEAKHKEEIEQAREETRRQCADAILKILNRSKGVGSISELHDACLNAGKQDKGEGV